MKCRLCNKHASGKYFHKKCLDNLTPVSPAVGRWLVRFWTMIQRENERIYLDAKFKGLRNLLRP